MAQRVFALIVLALSAVPGNGEASCRIDDRGALLRKQIESTQTLLSFGDLFQTLPVTEEYVLEVDPVHTQIGPLCWAYAAFHALRTYYSHVDGASAVWRDFLNGLDNPQIYHDYIVSHVAEEGGWPNEAVSLYEASIGSSAPEKWTSFVPSETQIGWGEHPGPDAHTYTPKAYFKKLEQIIDDIRIALSRGAPSAYCTTYHCVAIYGAKYSGNTALEYSIADSQGATYTADASQLHKTIADITTISR